MRSLREKIAVVTGAASGIGKAISLRLAGEGTHLLLIDLNEQGLHRTATEARQKDVTVHVHTCDLSLPEEITASVERLGQTFGHADLLVNNAGIAYYGHTDRMCAEHCERLLAVNLLAPVQLTRELLPVLLSRPEAHVLNVASFFGFIGARKVAAYSASKFGLVGFSEALRAEYARTALGVSVLCPGFVDTELFRDAPRGSDRQAEKRPPRWLMTRPERIADAAVRGIYRNQAIIITQSYPRLLWLAKRFVPGLIDWANHLSRKGKRVHTDDQADASPTRRAA